MQMFAVHVALTATEHLTTLLDPAPLTSWSWSVPRHDEYRRSQLEQLQGGDMLILANCLHQDWESSDLWRMVHFPAVRVARVAQLFDTGDTRTALLTQRADHRWVSGHRMPGVNEALMKSHRRRGLPLRVPLALDLSLLLRPAPPAEPLAAPPVTATPAPPRAPAPVTPAADGRAVA
ncbi:hypothetical protein ABZW18_26215 [Streptomyces sp. NPDC004647]|uniref:hypothetical protein n=1 Tax=Streptomyces sp. NPDC004647 TaxID=3154671 RepID=UPI00339FA9CF